MSAAGSSGGATCSVAGSTVRNNAPTTVTPIDATFVEKQDRFGWHRGMLIDDAKYESTASGSKMRLANGLSSAGE